MDGHICHGPLIQWQMLVELYNGSRRDVRIIRMPDAPRSIVVKKCPPPPVPVPVPVPNPVNNGNNSNRVRWHGPTQTEIDLQIETTRQRYEFWTKITIGGYVIGVVLTGGALGVFSAGHAGATGLVPAFAP